jgi:hypothetical protein
VHAWGVEGAIRNETGEAGVKSSPKPDVKTSSRSTLVPAITDLPNMDRVKNTAFRSVPEAKAMFLYPVKWCLKSPHLMVLYAFPVQIGRKR